MINTRLIFTAAALPADQARAIVALICSNKSTTFEQTRNKIENHFKDAVVRVLGFAKHETLRKLNRHMHSHRPIMGQDEPADQPADHPDAIRVAFNVDELKRDLTEMLATQIPAALNTASSDTLDSLGFRDPWKLPAQDALDFIASRQNLLSGVPDDIFQEIRKEISAGMLAGEPVRDLAARITKAFDQIENERATLIAQTETAAAYGFASHNAAIAAGIKYKKWVHSVIPEVPRPDHLAINGLIVPIDQAFPAGDPPLMYPHAPDGSAEDVINCRCISVPVLESEYKAQQNG